MRDFQLPLQEHRWPAQQKSRRGCQYQELTDAHQHYPTLQVAGNFLDGAPFEKVVAPPLQAGRLAKLGRQTNTKSAKDFCCSIWRCFPLSNFRDPFSSYQPLAVPRSHGVLRQSRHPVCSSWITSSELKVRYKGMKRTT